MAVFRASKAKFPTPPPAFAFHPAVSPSVAQLKTTAVTTNRTYRPKETNSRLSQVSFVTALGSGEMNSLGFWWQRLGSSKMPSESHRKKWSWLYPKQFPHLTPWFLTVPYGLIQSISSAHKVAQHPCTWRCVSCWLFLNHIPLHNGWRPKKCS